MKIVLKNRLGIYDDVEIVRIKNISFLKEGKNTDQPINESLIKNIDMELTPEESVKSIMDEYGRIVVRNLVNDLSQEMSNVLRLNKFNSNIQFSFKERIVSELRGVAQAIDTYNTR